MFTLDFGDHRPLYEQIREKIKELIVSGALAEGEKIPSVRELAAQLSINPNTIQKAYKDLELEGYIYSVRGRGNFVAPAAEANKVGKTDELLESFKGIVMELYFFKTPKSAIDEIINDIYKE